MWRGGRGEYEGGWEERVKEGRKIGEVNLLCLFRTALGSLSRNRQIECEITHMPLDKTKQETIVLFVH